MHQALLLAHLLGVVVWVGGMFFMAICLHPALATLAGKDRATLVVTTLTRFFGWVAVAIVMLWVSGTGMVFAAAGSRLPLGWHLMIGAAALMTLIFGYVRYGPFRAARDALAAGRLTEIAPRLARVRMLVLINLALGVLAIAAVTLLG
ncbi:MAG: hypothetical protein AB7G13_24280 [Lautropia sp.]